MAVPEPMTFVDGDVTGAVFQSGIGDVLTWLMSTAPFVIARVTTPIDLTAGVFTSVTFDTVLEGNGDLLTGVPEPGVYIGYSSLRTTPIRGNKNIRAQRNGAVDVDDDPWAGDSNMFGVQTTAKSGLTTFFAEGLDGGDYMDIGLFIDDGTTTPAQIVNGRFFMAWFRNRTPV